VLVFVFVCDDKHVSWKEEYADRREGILYIRFYSSRCLPAATCISFNAPRRTTRGVYQFVIAVGKKRAHNKGTEVLAGEILYCPFYG